jgi:hypothetical protein
VVKKFVLMSITVPVRTAGEPIEGARSAVAENRSQTVLPSVIGVKFAPNSNLSNSGVSSATAVTSIPLAGPPTATALGAFTMLGTSRSNSETKKLIDFFDTDFCECI